MVDTKKPPTRKTQDMPAADVRAGKKEKDSTKDVERGDPAPSTVRIPPPSQRWESDTDLAKTTKLEAALPATRGAPPRAGASHSEAPKSGQVEGIELVVVDERQVAGGERRPWRAAEVWTKRRVYGLDSTFRCVEILDRQTGRPEVTHEMLGARLGGGRMRDKDAVRFSYPLPLPGMEAMFSKGKKHGYTSIIERMIVRVRVLHTSADEASPSWDDIASRWSEVPPRP